MTKIISVNNTQPLASWQKELANAIENSANLLNLLNILVKSASISNIARKQ